MNQEKIGLFIKGLRNERKMTQADLAKKLNVTDRAVSKWERGKGLPDISLLEDLSDIFDVSILEILKGERLEKESIKDTNILDMLKYAKEDKKNFINKVVNIVCLFIIILTGLFLGIKNIKSIYYQNKRYKADYYIEYDLSNKYKDISHDIELIRNNRGKYSNEEYEYILDIVDKFEKSMNYALDKKTLDKSSFNVEELSSYARKQRVSFNYSEVEDLMVILLKYDSSIFKDIKNIDVLYMQYLQHSSIISIQEDVYYYDFKERESGVKNVSALYSSILSKYEIIELALTNIINVGEVYE